MPQISKWNRHFQTDKTNLHTLTKGNKKAKQKENDPDGNAD
jgi:hypothetical protein